MKETINLHDLMGAAIVQNVQVFTDFVRLLSPFDQQVHVRRMDVKYELWVCPGGKGKDQTRKPGKLLGSLFVVEQSIHLYLFPLLKPATFDGLLTTSLMKVKHGRYTFRISEFDLELKKDLHQLLDKMVLSLSQYEHPPIETTDLPSMPPHNFVSSSPPTGKQMEIFWTLIDLLQPYSLVTKVERRSAYSYALVVHRVTGNARKKQKEGELFAGVQIQKDYVGFYFFPLHIDKTLKNRLPKKLLTFLKDVTSFHFTELSPETIGAIKTSLKQGGTLYHSLGLMRKWD